MQIRRALCRIYTQIAICAEPACTPHCPLWRLPCISMSMMQVSMQTTQPLGGFMNQSVQPQPTSGDDALQCSARTTRVGDMQYRTLGSTGENVSLVGLGGSHIGKVDDEQLSLRIMRSAIDRGLTFMDNSWDYNEGQSELRMGRALRDGYRDKVFLMSKIDGRPRQAAAQQIDESLRRLQTDRVDLMQFHEVIRLEDPDRIFAAGGAVEAMLAAQKAGKIRYIGFTGHKDPYVHLRMLTVAQEHDLRFDTVQ